MTTNSQMLKPSLIALLLSASASVFAQEGIVTIEGARIRGDQESPTVLYVVPWQPPAVTGLQAPKGGLTMEGAIAPLERTEFQRTLSYHKAFRAQQDTSQEQEGVEPK